LGSLPKASFVTVVAARAPCASVVVMDSSIPIANRIVIFRSFRKGNL
jgi:hypothetical protein